MDDGRWTITINNSVWHGSGGGGAGCLDFTLHCVGLGRAMEDWIGWDTLRAFHGVLGACLPWGLVFYWFCFGYLE
ncbi:hypothetical protein B0J18DRAFT_421839 [Chaetomium sp. MPI-SDFR-AT-0129]|nr:hypothetical protein B0J18DRAFT_421839 [Chaetomium sp. MPI-SDFR-AT-0129]